MGQGLRHTLLENAYTGDDRRSAPRRGADDPRKPPVLRRRTINLLAILSIAAILYGTFAPFRLDVPTSPTWGIGWHHPVPGDTITNVLLYIPIGALLRLMFRRRGSWWVSECGLSLMAAAGLSYLTEVSQTVVPTRVPSWTDTVFNVGGAFIGIALAPLVQRMLRNTHTWLYQGVRREPFRTAAATGLIGLLVYGLMPFDVHPTPGHVVTGLMGFLMNPIALFSESGLGLEAYAPAGAVQVLDKLMAGGAYALVAFLLLLAARERGESKYRAVWYALSRIVALVAVIEGLQIFTLSHVADLRDVVAASTCASLVLALGWVLMIRWPTMHQHPGAVLRSLVGVGVVALVAWVGASVLLSEPARLTEAPSWLPLLNQLHRPWEVLLGDYVTGLLRCGLAAGLLALWQRSRHRQPGAVLVVGGALLMVLAASAVRLMWQQQAFDTGQFVLALVAGVIVFQMDRALFGAQPIPAMPTPDAPAAPPATGA